MPKTPKDMPLTAKRERFIAEYLIDYNATRAALRAGYSAQTASSIASKYLAQPETLARVRELQAEQLKRLSFNADWVVLQLQECVAKSMQHTPVIAYNTETREYEPTGEYQYDSRGVTKRWLLHRADEHECQRCGEATFDSQYE